MAEQQDIWTTIPSKKNKKNRSAAQPSQAASPGLPSLSSDMTTAKVQQDIQASTRIWRQSSARKQLLATLNRLRPDGGWQIRRAVCLGSGSFSRDNMESRRRSVMQFAMFMDLVDSVKRNGEEDEMDVLVQEPRYTNVDTEWLESSRCRVLEYELCDEHTGLGPARECCGPETLVCELFIEQDASTMQGLCGSENGLLITTARRHLNTNETLIRKLSGQQKLDLSALLNRYQAIYFPRFEEDPQVFEGLEVLAPVPSEDD